MKNIENYIHRIRIRRRKRREMKKWEKRITDNIGKLEHRRKLTEGQIAETQAFWKDMIGQEIPLYCHEFFYSRTGKFTKEYVPNNIYHCELIPKANLHRMQGALGDKNMCDYLFRGENIVPSILKNINGYYYYKGRAVSESEAIALCSNLEQVVIKPSRESEGKGVQLLSVNDGMTSLGKSLADLFKEYGRDFLIQSWVQQHRDMAALNPTSVNTLRILSYRSGMEVLIIYSVVRIGRRGAIVDNQCAGGISTTIDEHGRLGGSAFGGYSTDDVQSTDTGIALAGYQIPSYDKAIDFVKRLHLRLPYFNIVGWDVVIMEDGEPALIEFNTNPGLSQSAFGSGMGQYTERIVRELWPRPNTWFNE